MVSGGWGAVAAAASNVPSGDVPQSDAVVHVETDPAADEEAVVVVVVVVWVAAGAGDGIVVDDVVTTGRTWPVPQVTFVGDTAAESVLIAQERTTVTRTPRLYERCGPAMALDAASNKTAIAGTKNRMSGVV